MKKMLFVIMLLALGAATVKAQKGSRLLPLKTNGTPYSKPELRQYILDHPYYAVEFYNTIQSALDRAGVKLAITLDNRSLDWCLGNIEFSQKTLVRFRNSYKVGELIYFFDDANYTGIIGTFNYLACHEDVIKAECGNFIHPFIYPDEPAPIAVVPAPTPAPQPAPRVVPTSDDGYRAQVAAETHQNSPTPAYSTSSSEEISQTDIEYKGGWQISIAGIGGSSNSCYDGYNNGYGQSSSGFGGGAISFGKGATYSDHSYSSGTTRSSSAGMVNNGGYNGGNYNSPGYNPNNRPLSTSRFGAYNNALVNQTGRSLVGNTGYNIATTAD